MALFNPPLPRFGNKKCPNCGHPVGWKRDWFGISPEWLCPQCRSLLGRDRGRRLIAYLPTFIPLVVISVNIFIWPVWAVVSVSIGWFALVVFSFWWLESVVVRCPPQAEVGSPVKP